VPSNPLLGKFGPIVLLAVVQLVLVLAAPSTAPSATTAGTTPYGTPTTGPGVTAAGPGGTVTGPGGTVTGPGGTVTGPGGTVTGPGGTVTGPGGTTNGGRTTNPGTQGLTGSTKHCVSGRQYSPSLDYYAPPCVPGIPGAAFPNNGGATYQGVTDKTIELVVYVADYGAEVDAILKAQGLYYSASDAKVWNAAYAKFINTHYQLYGRQLHIDTIQGGCRTVPPDYQCLIKDMDSLVAKYHPYGVLWDTTVCSQCYAELSRLHVVNFGGSGFSDAFHNANAPYSYDAGESATQIELNFADWWCHQMTSVGGTGRTAIFAGTQNPRQNFRKKSRVLGVISTDDPDNQNTIKNVLYPALRRGCGERVTHEYFYAQDINTATQQSQATAAKMNTTTNPATSVACFCDPVAPQFGQNAFAVDNYWPESILASDQTMDWDSNAQTYSSGGQSAGLSCPNPKQGCPWDNAIGVGAEGPQENMNDIAAVKIYRASSGSKSLPKNGQPPALSVAWANLNMFATMIQATGPTLNPTNMQSAALHLPARGGGTTGHELRVFTAGGWCWIKDARIVYWNKNKKSPYNGKNGTYVQIEGSRFTAGHFPSVKQPPAPLPENRK
jgi:hypothetical protein